MKEISVGENILTKIQSKELGMVKIGVSTTLCKYFLIPELKQFIKTYPNIQMRIINKTTYDTLKLVEEEEVDFGIVSQPYDCGNYNFTKLKEIEDIFVSTKEYLAKYNIKEPNEIFSKATLMLLESNNITRKYIDNYFAKNNIDVHPEIEISSMDFLVEFAKIGLGVTAVIKDFIEEDLREGNLIEIPIEPSIPKRTIGIVCHKKLSLSIAAQTFKSFLEDMKE